MPPVELPSSSSPKPNEPRRAIRTFQSDTEFIKSGATPDFKYLEEESETPQPQQELSALPDEKSKNSIGSFIPKDIGNPIPMENEVHTPERLVASSPLEEIPAPPPAAPPPPPVELPTPVPRNEAPIHTFTSDFSEKMRDENASTASVIAAESDASQPTARLSYAGTYYAIAGLLLVVLGAAGAYGAYRYTHQAVPEPVSLTPNVSSPIFVDDRVKIAGKGLDLMTAIQEELTKPIQSSSVRILYTDASSAGEQSVFNALQLPTPAILTRNISASGSIAGIIAAHATASPFFILSVLSYGDTFAGMLAWEPTMLRDLTKLYPQISTPPVGTTTKPVLNPIPSKFKDEVIANHDARVLRDSGGTSLLLYGYWNPTTLIIAKDEDSFIELVSRLSSSRTQK